MVGSNICAKHELVRLAVAVVVVVADDVLTVAPVEQVGVGATAAFDAVVAGASRERIGSIAVRILRFDDVITATPVDGVASSGTKGDRVVAFSTQQRVGTAATIGNDVVPSTAVDGVAAVAVGDSVVAAVAIQRVVVSEAIQRVGSVRTVYHVAHRVELCFAQTAAIAKDQSFNLILAAAVPVFDDDLVGRRCVVRVVDFDYQVVAGTAYEQVTRHNARAEHELVRLAVAVVVVVADDVLTVAPVEQVGVISENGK